MLWLRVIQDFDFCENRAYGLVSYEASSTKCKDGWVYSMIDAITELAPRFKPAYKSGALFLSVLVNDAAGASAILEKAVRMFPYDWNLFYIAAYQAMAEENDSAKASRLLVRAGQLGAPSWVFPLAARLSLKEGQLELSKSILESALNEQLTPEVKERVRERLDQVNRQISNSK
jgi:hypothetical protein